MGLLSAALGALGVDFGFGIDDLVEEAVQEAQASSKVSEAADEALDSAGNEGQTAILEGCVDSWSEYAMACLMEDPPEEVDPGVLESMCGHPEAVSEIIQTFAAKCNGDG